MKKLFLILLLVSATSPVLAHANEATTTPDLATTTPDIIATTTPDVVATTTPEVSTSTPSTATITIRDGDIVAFTGIVELAASTSPAVDIAPTNSSSTVAIPPARLLATLVALDATTTDFDITDLAYFSSFDSFIINCITVPAVPTTPHCFNWTYAVDGTFPQVGIDDTLLQDGDIVHLFFGPPRQTVLSTTTVAVDDPFTATAQRYDLDSGMYVGVAGVVLGVGISNPDFSFTEFATSTSDVNGEAIFSMNATGTFAVGIQEDFYFPSASITIVDAPATTTDEAPEQEQEDVEQPSSGGGGGGEIVHFEFNVPLALSFLAEKQQHDGSLGALLYTDWAAFAFAASDPGNAPSTSSGQAKNLLREYLLTAEPSLESITDYERHAMALMALGIDPYTGAPKDYIAPIVAAFDGTQIGNASIPHDAIFPLLHAGYSASDEIIQKAVAFILSKQSASGSWGDPDTTAAAVQALVEVRSLPGVFNALSKAESYLHSQQQSNSGFSNSFSTSWVMQAIAALGQAPSQWSPSGTYPEDYLVSLQQTDGGIEPTSTDTNSRVWATSYAIPAALNRTWDSLLQSFSKPSTAGGNGAVLGVSTSTVSTSSPQAVSTTTPIVATSTPAVSTSTPPTVDTGTTTPVVATTSGTIKPPAKKSTVVKKPTPVPKASVPAPPATSSQTIPTQVAAAASTAPKSFLGKIWQTVTSFFAWIF